MNRGSNEDGRGRSGDGKGSRRRRKRSSRRSRFKGRSSWGRRGRRKHIICNVSEVRGDTVEDIAKAAKKTVMSGGRF